MEREEPKNILAISNGVNNDFAHDDRGKGDTSTHHRGFKNGGTEKGNGGNRHHGDDGKTNAT